MAGVSLVLDGKVVLVTGGSRGIGAETVRLFLQAGARVAFSYRQARERAEALQAEYATAGQGEPGHGDLSVAPVRCLAIRQQLSTPADGRALVTAAVAAFGRLDVLVVNHGIWPTQDVPISAMTEQQWRRTLDVNLDSVFGLVQAAVTQMEAQIQAQKEKPAGASAAQDKLSSDVTGHIVLISSTAGQRGEANHADYAVTKGALISLTKSLSSELASSGIRVNCVAPGWVATDMSAPALGDPEVGAKIKAAIPVGRVASTREIAGPVLFLCTPLAAFISGEVLNVNGGSVLMG
jgi:3-oxoacyl-[acyl-carrier protein] reductase